MSLQASHLRFGEFILDRHEKILSRDGRPVSLPPKALELLLVLLEKPGHIVQKDLLFERVWPNTFVEEGNLTYTITLLRKALNDDAENPQYIETIPRRGYRFIAALSSAETRGEEDTGVIPGENADALLQTPSSLAASGRRTLGIGRIVAALALVSLLTGAIAFGYYFFTRKRTIAGDKRSIAVLPFVNESGNADIEYLSDGISETLINSLSELEQLKVVARATAFRFKNRQSNPSDVGRELGVDTVLTGKVTSVGDTLIVQADLIDVSDGSQIWGERYTKKLADLISVPESISRGIITSLQPKLSSEASKQFAELYAGSSHAYELDMKGRFFWNRRTEEGLRKGIEYFDQAIAEDPNYALAHVGLADSYNVMGFYTFLRPDESFPKAKVAARRALELNPDLAQAHNSLAYTALYYDWDFDTAEKEFRRAIELKPNYAVAHQWYGNLLTATGRWDEALQSFRRAHELDPLSQVITAVPAWTYYYSHDYDKAIEPCEKAIELDPNFALAHTWLGQAYERKGDHGKAIAEFKESLRISKGSTEVLALLAHTYAVSGDERQARMILDELIELSKQKYVSPYQLATVYTGLGETDLALKWLEKAYADRQHVMVFLNYDARLDSLRGDARFQDLVQRMDLPR